MSLNMDQYKNMEHKQKGELEYFQFAHFIPYHQIFTHGFTTRKGGVSKGKLESLNLGFNKEDLQENVFENYRRISTVLGIDYKNMVFSNQVHDDKIRLVNEGDRGKGITQKSDIVGVDGLITNTKEVALVTFYADCVPILFFDPVKNAIGSTHSGWRGTVKKIAEKTVEAMENEFKSKAENMLVGIGPSIGVCCFEVGEEVISTFLKEIPWSEAYIHKVGIEKWKVYLQGIIKETLLRKGVLETNILDAGICTKCHKDLFFSYRGDEGKTGSLAGIMQLI